MKKIARCKVVGITPSIPEEKLKNKKKCFFGASIANPKFYGSSLESYLHWIDNTFEECLALIADYPHRLNEEINLGYVGQKGLNTALKRADGFISELELYLKQFNKCKFGIIRCEPIYKSQEFIDENKKFVEISKMDTEFYSDLLATANMFVDKKENQGIIKISREKAIENSIIYLLEEFTVFYILSKQGWKVHPYPSFSLDILKNISLGKFKTDFGYLAETTYVDLRIKSPLPDQQFLHSLTY